MTNSTNEWLKLETALQEAERLKTLQKSADEDDNSDGGDSGRSGGSGTEIKKELFVEVFGLLRSSEKKFGIANDFDAAAYLAKSKRSFERGSMDYSGGLKAHPILSKLAKFDGDTPDMNMQPNQNDRAVERFENRLAMKMGLKNRYIPDMKPRGG